MRGTRCKPRRPRPRLAGPLLCLVALIPPAGAVAAAPVGPVPSAAFAVVITMHPGNGTAPLRESFDAYPTSGVADRYNWSFGDGSWLNSSAADAATPVHLFASPGTFEVAVVVWEGSVSAVGRLTVDAADPPLVVVVAASTQSGTAPFLVLFWANATGGTGTYVSYNWSFGDGGHGAGPVVSNDYRTGGQFTASVVVNDSAGHSQSAAITLDVAAPPTNGSGGSPTGPPWTFWAGLGVGALAAAAGVGGYLRMRRRWGFDPPTEAPGPGTEPGADELAAEISLAAPEPQGTTATPSDPSVSDVLGAPMATELSGSAAAAPVPAGTTGPEPDLAQRRLLSRRIVIHLAEIGRLGPADTPDVRWTQRGIGERLGVEQNRASNVLRRLVAAGVLRVETRHVAGLPRRMKVYTLTDRGETVALGYRRAEADARRRPPA